MVEPDIYTKAAIRQMRRYTWKPKLAIFRHRCHLSGEPIPAFSKAYRGFRILSGPGEDIVIYEWATPDAYLIEKLRGTL